VPRPYISTKPGLSEIDYDEKRVAVPGLSPGDILEYDVVIIIQPPWAQGEFYVHYRFEPSIVADEQLEIDIPSGRAVKVKTRSGIDAWAGEGNKRKLYRWRSVNSTLGEPLFKSAPLHKPPDVQLSSFANWEEVGRWYADLE